MKKIESEFFCGPLFRLELLGSPAAFLDGDVPLPSPGKVRTCQRQAIPRKRPSGRRISSPDLQIVDLDGQTDDQVTAMVADDYPDRLATEK